MKRQLEGTAEWLPRGEPALPCRHSSTKAMSRLELPVDIRECEMKLFHNVDLA